MPYRDTLLDGDSTTTVDARVRDVRKDVWLMRAFQSRLIGPVLRRLGGPQDLVEMGMAFWSSRLILTAVECGVFTQLAAGPLAEPELTHALGWHPRAAGTALQALVAAGLLRQDAAGRYANTARTAIFLDRAKPSYVGGLMELSSTRLYELWSGLGDLLRTGDPAAEEERGQNEFFATLYRDPAALREFLAGMTGITTGEATLLAARFPWKRFGSFVDIGTAQGALPVRVALTHRHLRGTGFDFPAVRPIFEEYVASFRLDDRLRFIAGDFLQGPLPNADVISFGHVFHGRNPAIRSELAAKAYDAVPPGGAVIVYDAMTRPGRSHNHVSLLSSLNIMLESREGYESSTADCANMLRANGFVRIKVRHLIGPTSMVFGFKPGRLPATDVRSETGRVHAQRLATGEPPGHEVVVIGAGPTGVAVALSMRDRGLHPLLLDRADHVGSSWSGRYDRLRLNTGKQFSHLPNRPYPKHTPVFPTRDQVVDHLNRHVHQDGVQLRLNTEVRRIDRRPGGWCVRTSTGDIAAQHVVVATGYEHTPRIPDWPGSENFDGELSHSAAYRNPMQYVNQRVLVVGAGSSAMEIVHDIATGGAAKAWLAVRTTPNIMLRSLPGGFPSDFIATPLFNAPPRFADAMAELARRTGIGDLSEFGLPKPAEGPFSRGIRLGRAPAIIDKEVLDAIRNRTIEVVPAIESFDDGGVRLVDGQKLRPDAVICATGYLHALEPLVGHLGVLNDRGLPRAAGEVAGDAGLWFIGFESRPALIAHVARQSRGVARRIDEDLRRRPARVG
jgi:cation diffusion facilitator CzcD-associated flavoprotein CzcO